METKTEVSRIDYRTTFQEAVIYLGSPLVGGTNSAGFLLDKLVDTQRVFLCCTHGLVYHQNGYRQTVVRGNLLSGWVDGL